MSEVLAAAVGIGLFALAIGVPLEGLNLFFQ